MRGGLPRRGPGTLAKAAEGTFGTERLPHTGVPGAAMVIPLLELPGLLAAKDGALAKLTRFPLAGVPCVTVGPCCLICDAGLGSSHCRYWVAWNPVSVASSCGGALADKELKADLADLDSLGSLAGGGPPLGLSAFACAEAVCTPPAPLPVLLLLGGAVCGSAPARPGRLTVTLPSTAAITVATNPGEFT